MMKKSLFLSLLASFYLGLPVSTVYALDPGCSPDVMDLMQTQADAVRARNRAYAMEIINRDNSTLYLTCFDRAVAFSARLGYIFSEKVQAGPAPVTDVVWSGDVEYPDWGATHSIVLDFDKVITPELDNQLKNFYPDMPPKNQITLLAEAITPLIQRIKDFQEAEKQPSPVPAPAEYSVKDWNDAIHTVNDHINSFPTIPWADLPAAMDAFETGWDWTVGGAALIAASRARILQPILDDIKTRIEDVNMNSCTRLDDVWNDPDMKAGDPATAPFQPTADRSLTHFYPPEGRYYILSPYFTLADVVAPPSSPPASRDFRKELDNVSDSAVLSQALADLSGPLSRPGVGNTVWPDAPYMRPSISTAEVIDNM